MDRAIIEILNTNGLIIIATVTIILFQNIYLNTLYGSERLEIDAVSKKIENTIYKIYNNIREFNSSNDVVLIFNKYVYIKGNNHTLEIKIGNTKTTINTPLKVKGEANSKIIKFSYSNGTVLIFGYNSFISPLISNMNNLIKPKKGVSASIIEEFKSASICLFICFVLLNIIKLIDSLLVQWKAL